MEQSSTQMLWKVSAFLPPLSLFTLLDILSRGITSFYPTPRHVLLNEHSYMIARLCCCALGIQITGYSICMCTQFLLDPEFSTHERRNGCVGLMLGSETRVTETDMPRQNTAHCLPMLNMCGLLRVDSSPAFRRLIFFILMYLKITFEFIRVYYWW